MCTQYKPHTSECAYARIFRSSADLHFFENKSQIANKKRVTGRKFPEIAANPSNRQFCMGAGVVGLRTQRCPGGRGRLRVLTRPPRPPAAGPLDWSRA